MSCRESSNILFRVLLDNWIESKFFYSYSYIIGIYILNCQRFFLFWIQRKDVMIQILYITYINTHVYVILFLCICVLLLHVLPYPYVRIVSYTYTMSISMPHRFKASHWIITCFDWKSNLIFISQKLWIYNSYFKTFIFMVYIHERLNV